MHMLCFCESAHQLYLRKIQVLLVYRIDLMEVVKNFANWMITIFLPGSPFNLGIKIFIVDFFVIEGYIYKTVCTLFFFFNLGKEVVPSKVAEEKPLWSLSAHCTGLCG